MCILEVVNFEENLSLKFELGLLHNPSFNDIFMDCKGDLDIRRKLYEYLKECPLSGVKSLSAFTAGKIAIVELGVK